MKLFRAYILPVLLMASSLLAAAQDNDKVLNRPYADMKRLHYGFSVGFHNQNLWLTHNGYVTDNGEAWFADVTGLQPGFCVNILGDLRLAEHFNLRVSPGMYFGSKTVTFRDATNGTIEKQNIKNSSVVVPVDLKMSATRYHNVRPYVTAGVMAAFDVSKKKEGELLQLSNTDLYATVGFGLDVYVPFFKFIPEVKFCFGLRNLLQKDRPDLAEDPEKLKYTNSLDKAVSNMVVFTFYFE
ncbi:MAG: PorT family protein [Bacteroidetes bacterium]|uniref:PorT family protein n=1 Tax=Candidatus Limisoma faecipullorum TaxID=2840854 RepID=A0A9D9IM57_9BACT|nr:PorT family protein [Candidatus Limisoma faecipullorum]